MRALAAIAILGALAPEIARADGFYASESIGVSLPDDSLAPYLQQPMKVRLAVGARWHFVAVEPWLSSDLQLDRDGATRGILGGTPAKGTADLATYGIDAKLIGKLDEHLSAYVRVGPSRVDANGVLEGYSGWGAGASCGVQLTGRVRALGFLWAPLFFVKRGPMITGSLFLDQGVDFYRLRMAGAPELDARVAHVSIGFALGSDF